MTVQSEELAGVVQQIGDAVLITTETVENVSNHLDVLTQQVQQQGYQILALSESIQTLAENQDAAIARLDKLTTVLETLAHQLSKDPEAKTTTP